MTPALPTDIPVLDHGLVRLVDWMGTDLSVVRAARVSHDADWRAGVDEKGDERLIKYLLRNRHSTPFESCVLTFEIKCPLFVARQWHRHRTQSYNEVSARYTELPEEFYVPHPAHIGTQSTGNKQQRTLAEWDALTPEQKDDAKRVVALIESTCKDAFAAYHDLLAADVPREIARGVLPLFTYTRFFTTVNLHNLLHFLGLRDHSHAQMEIQVYAAALRKLAGDRFPVTLRARDELVAELSAKGK